MKFTTKFQKKNRKMESVMKALTEGNTALGASSPA